MKIRKLDMVCRLKHLNVLYTLEGIWALKCDGKMISLWKDVRKLFFYKAGTAILEPPLDLIYYNQV